MTPVERVAVAQQRHAAARARKYRQRPHLARARAPGALEHDAAHDTQEVRQRQHLANVPAPTG